MEKLSKSCIDKLVRLHRRIDEIVFEAAYALGRITGYEGAGYLSRIEAFNDTTLELSGEHSHCSCCGSDYYDLKIPTRFLYDPEGAVADWDATEGEKRRQEAAEQRAKMEQIERDLLVKLKEKYEGTDGNSTD